MCMRMLSWSGTKGGKIAVSFDDEHFGPKEMQTEIDFMQQVHPNPPDECRWGQRLHSPRRRRRATLWGAFG